MKNRFVWISFLFLFTPFWLGSKEPSLLPTSLALPGPEEFPKFVNVALLIDVPAVSVKTEGAYVVSGKSESDVFFRGKGPFEATVRAQKGRIEINGQIYPTDRMVVSSPGGAIQVEKRQYLDQIKILKQSETELTVINRISLENYLRGVLPLEVPSDWPPESLKAHAVVSRTFALFKAIEKKDEAFSLYNTVLSQVYGGSLFHKVSTDQAIRATQGEILTFEGNIFPSYFHASCGGRTARADLAWPVRPNRVLNGVKCDFCKGAKHWEWKLNMPLSDIEKIMQKNGYPAKNLKRVSFTAYDPTGRALKVLLEYARSKVLISAGDFRLFLGPNRLRSLKADAETKGDQVRFHGLGWGHGVGFCQWGAKGQAEAGRNYREIIQHYFPGSELKKIY